MQVAINAVVMRGGTSRALFFRESDLPIDQKERDDMILSAMGSPDPSRKQTDGLGGGLSSTSKVAIIATSKDPRFDVVYTFGQVAIDSHAIDYKGNFGNISSAVGPYAIVTGMVPAVAPLTQVRIHQKNTNSLIVADVPVVNGRFEPEGDYEIPGVPGSGSRISLSFHNPGGGITGRLLPTGRAVDYLDVPELGRIPFSLVDAANPCVFVRTKDFGCCGHEMWQMSNQPKQAMWLEAVRSHAATLCGLAGSPAEASAHSQAIPKIAMISPPQDYLSLSGQQIKSTEIDLTIRLLSMGEMHRAIAVTAAICCAGAAGIPGNLVTELFQSGNGSEMRLGHPGGIVEVCSEMETEDGIIVFRKGSIGRTARVLMRGEVFVFVNKK